MSLWKERAHYPMAPLWDDTVTCDPEYDDEAGRRFDLYRNVLGLGSGMHSARAADPEIKLLREYKRVIDHSTIVSMTDRNGTIIHVNEQFSRISGYSREELLGNPHNIIRHPDTPSSLFREMWSSIESGEIWHGIIKNRKKSGEVYFVDTTIAPIFNAGGEIEKYMAIRYDVTHVIEQEQRLNRQFHDRLTMLPNRTKLIEDLEEGDFTAAAILNIDAFQEINDLYGQKFGDKVLQAFALNLGANLDTTHYTLYKLPGDEFAILAGAVERELFAQMLIRLIYRLDASLMRIDENEIHLSVTAGISCGNGLEMLGNANIALKRAKGTKRPFERFNDDTSEKERYAHNQKMLRTLKQAIAHDRVVPFYQPIFCNATRRIVKYEALMRIVDEEGSYISPFAFLELAKKARLYPKLTKAMIDKVLSAFDRRNESVSINISIADIVNPTISHYLFERLDAFSEPARIVIEITETEGIENYDIVREFVGQVKRLGVKVAIDDFGSGYSNFMHLLELNADYIKIDGSIIKNIYENTHSQILTRSIVNMAKELGMGVIAEYVSSEEIFETVRLLDVEESQGFYLGEPALLDC